MDEIQLDSAAGIIANFSGGEDLTFSEVAGALTHLQQQAGGEAEIIPGVISDPNLTNRAQVILIVTGLGAVPIQQVIPDAEKYLSEIHQHTDRRRPDHISTSASVSRIDDQGPTRLDHGWEPRQPAGLASSDIDLPAFLRKRIER